MKNSHFYQDIQIFTQLLRWDKPSGRLILLIPAGWSLWLTPITPPEKTLILTIIIGGLSISAAGCIINDIWDKAIDKKVSRTKNRPLANGSIALKTALFLLCLMLLISLFTVFSIPLPNRNYCLALASLALPIILIYPSAKRWFYLPQLLLSLCWGFAVLIPWAASESNLHSGWPLWGCWIATLSWTFGFDTVYAMADRQDDKSLNLNSSAINLKGKIIPTVSCCYAFSCISLALAANFAKVGWIFWPIWLIASLGMQKETWKIKESDESLNIFSSHFRNQVWLGSFIWFGLLIGRIN